MENGVGDGLTRQPAGATGQKKVHTDSEQPTVPSYGGGRGGGVAVGWWSWRWRARGGGRGYAQLAAAPGQQPIHAADLTGLGGTQSSCVGRGREWCAPRVGHSGGGGGGQSLSPPWGARRGPAARTGGPPPSAPRAYDTHGGGREQGRE